MRNVVTFVSDAHFSAPREDFAQWLGGELRARGRQADDDIVQEDFGSVPGHVKAPEERVEDRLRRPTALLGEPPRPTPARPRRPRTSRNVAC